MKKDLNEIIKSSLSNMGSCLEILRELTKLIGEHQNIIIYLKYEDSQSNPDRALYLEYLISKHSSIISELKKEFDSVKDIHTIETQFYKDLNQKISKYNQELTREDKESIINGIKALILKRNEMLAKHSNLKVINYDEYCINNLKKYLLTKKYFSAMGITHGFRIKDFYSMQRALEVFDPTTIAKISSPLAEALNDPTYGELLAKDWYSTMALVPGLAEHIADDDIKTDALRIIKCLYKMNLLVHAYGLVIDEVKIGQYTHDLGFSYPGLMSELTDKHGRDFAAKYRIADSKFFDANKFIAERSRTKSEAYSLETFNISKTINTDVHLISLVLCQSKIHGNIIAIGDRGGDTEYSGIRILRINNPDAIDTFRTRLLDQVKPSYSDQELDEILSILSLSELEATEGMEQLNNTCGLESQGELNELSKTVFTALHSITRGDLDTAIGIAIPYHNKQMQDLRLQLWQDFTEFTKAHPKITIDSNFFDDLSFAANRLGLTLPIPRSKQAYVRYYEFMLKRYEHDYLSPKEFHYVKSAMDGLFGMYSRLSNNYDEQLLGEMRALDEKLHTCMLVGFDKFRAIARNASDEKFELSSSNPLLQQTPCISRQLVVRKP